MHKIRLDHNINLVINKLIDEYKQNRLSLTSNNEDFIDYLTLLRSTYVRTIEDVLAYGKSPEKQLRVLEIGGFTGIVSVWGINLSRDRLTVPRIRLL